MAPRTRTHFHRDRGGRPGPWKHGAIPVIGLIGGIGGGKSLAAAALARRGAFVLDADAVGHALLDQTPVRERVVERFGTGVLAPSTDPDEPPHIDRRALGEIVFAQPSALCDLETILHPIMRRTFERAIARTVRRGKARGVVLDAAILLEAEWDSLCDRVVFIDAPRDRGSPAWPRGAAGPSRPWRPASGPSSRSIRNARGPTRSCSTTPGPRCSRPRSAASGRRSRRRIGPVVRNGTGRRSPRPAAVGEGAFVSR